jgi:hypothetical protein
VGHLLFRNAAADLIGVYGRDLMGDAFSDLVEGPVLAYSVGKTRFLLIGRKF